ncbi:hypothetical protein NpNSSI1_00003821 [Neofusicoccum parvum]|nr:hypothetical protein NpNSSI1_00003821 [Neofusicoccum parvum]
MRDTRRRKQAASPPSEPHGEDRLGRVESAVSRFEERMRQVERALEQAGLLVLTGGGDEDDGHPVARVVDRDQALLDTFADQMGDMAADINTEVDDKLDEMLANVKDEVRGWAQDTYEELLETRLDELVEQRLADAVWTVSRCN